MKKLALTGTSALALATAFATLSVSQTQAADFEMHIGGYFESRIAYSSVDIKDDPATNQTSNVDGKYDGVDVKRDSEIHLKPSATLDNGIRIGANIQLEGADESDQIDEAYMFIDGAFGRVLLGSENSARYLMHYAAPTAGSFEVNHGDAMHHIPYEDISNHGDDTLRGTLGSSFVENNRHNDSERITYFTPRMSGFQFGVSYARDRRQDSNRQADNSFSRNTNITDFGLNYVGEIGSIDLAVAAGYGIALHTLDDDVSTIEVDESDQPQVWNAGVNVGWRGWTLGGSFAEQNSTGANDGTFFDGGIMYEIGPWGISLAYARGENQDDEEPFEGIDEILDQYVIGLDYDLARGVKLNGYAAYVVFEEDLDQNGEFSALDGYVFGTGMRIDF